LSILIGGTFFFLLCLVILRIKMVSTSPRGGTTYTKTSHNIAAATAGAGWFGEMLGE
jgi:hypothetical protein